MGVEDIFQFKFSTITLTSKQLEDIEWKGDYARAIQHDLQAKGQWMADNSKLQGEQPVETEK